MEYDTIVLKEDRSSGIRGAIVENFVLNEIDYALGREEDSYYWTNGTGKAEVDFQFLIGTETVPVEVKSGKVGRIQSLETYCSRYHPKAAFVISRKNVRIGKDGEYTFVPLYMAWKFHMYAEAAGLEASVSDPPALDSWEPPSEEMEEEKRV